MKGVNTMKISTIIKSVVAVAAIYATGAAVYSKLKEHENTEELENDISETETETQECLTAEKKVIAVTGFMAYSYILAKLVKKATIKQVEDSINSDPTIALMRNVAISALRLVQNGDLSLKELFKYSEPGCQEVM